MGRGRKGEREGDGKGRGGEREREGREGKGRDRRRVPYFGSVLLATLTVLHPGTLVRRLAAGATGAIFSHTLYAHNIRCYVMLSSQILTMEQTIFIIYYLFIIIAILRNITKLT